MPTFLKNVTGPQTSGSSHEISRGMTKNLAYIVYPLVGDLIMRLTLFYMTLIWGYVKHVREFKFENDYRPEKLGGVSPIDIGDKVPLLKYF